MDQTNLIQNIMATSRQAEAIGQDARQTAEHAEERIDQEIRAMESDYQEKAEAYLKAMEEFWEKNSGEKLAALDEKLEKNLKQVESLYQAKKDIWVDSILQRILGKAGD